MNTDTAICGYCNASHQPSRPCTCPAQRAAFAGRRLELDRLHRAQRVGAAMGDGQGQSWGSKGGWR